MLGVNNNHVMVKGKRQSKKSKKEIKVTYISSPVKVKTSASNFRALVQELTGKYSNVAEMFVGVNGGAHHHDHIGVHNGNSTQQYWGSNSGEAYYLPDESAWMKPDYTDLRSSPSMEPLDGHLQFDFLNFDMI